jgi:hypothetical protein
MIAHLVRVAEDEDKNSEWSPETVSLALGKNNETEVVSKISIPAATGGLILGRAGSTIKSIAEESGAKILMTGKDEALFTHERVLTISGETGACIKCTELILAKLDEQEDLEPYVNRGTTYASPLTSTFGFGGHNNQNNGQNGNQSGRGGGRFPRNNNTNGPRDNNRAPHRDQLQQAHDGNPALSISDTTITLSIPNELIGNIFGKQV